MKYLNKIGSILLLLMILGFVGCAEKKYNYPEEAKSKGNLIHDFAIEGMELDIRTISGDSIVIIVPRGFDKSVFADVAPTFKISAAAEVSPESGTKVNLMESAAKYNVVAESGDVREWTVSVMEAPLAEHGFGEGERFWFNDAWTDEYGFDANPNSIGFIDDYLVVSRTEALIDIKTGKLAAKKLNISGMEANAPANALPFVFANDDAGNLFGCVLGAWSTPNFRIYHWDSPEKAPKKVLDYEAKPITMNNVNGQSVTFTPNFGRKLVAVGDLLSGGYIGSNDIEGKKSKSARAANYFWKMNNGTVQNEPEIIETGVVSGGYYQMVSPLQKESLYPYVMMDNGFAGNPPAPGVIYYKASEEASLVDIKGPYEELGNNGWQDILNIKTIPFNNATYVLVLSRTTDNYFITLLDYKDGTFDIAYKDKIDNIGSNGNGTVSATYRIVDKGHGISALYVYSLFTGAGIICHEFTNLAKID